MTGALPVRQRGGKGYEHEALLGGRSDTITLSPMFF